MINQHPIFIYKAQQPCIFWEKCMSEGYNDIHIK